MTYVSLVTQGLQIAIEQSIAGSEVSATKLYSQ